MVMERRWVKNRMQTVAVSKLSLSQLKMNPPQPWARLTFTTGSLHLAYQLYHHRVKVGYDSVQNDISINLNYIHEVHFVIERHIEDGQHTITNLYENGIWLNNTKHTNRKPHLLKSRDVILF